VGGAEENRKKTDETGGQCNAEKVVEWNGNEKEKTQPWKGEGEAKFPAHFFVTSLQGVTYSRAGAGSYGGEDVESKKGYFICALSFEAS